MFQFLGYDLEDTEDSTDDKEKREGNQAEMDMDDLLLPLQNALIGGDPNEARQAVSSAQQFLAILNASGGSCGPTSNVMQLNEKIQIEIRDTFKKLNIASPPEASPSVSHETEAGLVGEGAGARGLDSNLQVDPQPCSLSQDEIIDDKLKKILQLKQLANEKYLNLLATRMKLPVFKKKQEILDLLETHQVVVISGETGCGKTTQVSQFILDDYILKGKGSLCRIVCTQPRRISAVSVASRVADERVEVVGNASVGYQIRCEKLIPDEKRGTITFCTTGIVIQWLQSDPFLREVSHILLDEVHERDIYIDCLMALIKDILKVRTDLKVILMSATMNADRFSNYFNQCPFIHIPGETFPIKEYYLEDVLQLTGFRIDGPQYKLRRDRSNLEEYTTYINHLQPYIRRLEMSGMYSAEVTRSLRCVGAERIHLRLVRDLIKHICLQKGEGAILVFLPGWNDIAELYDMLTQMDMFNNDKYAIFQLHSMIAIEEQQEVFQTLHGVRKIILSTNIAETSITIDDVTFVIDCGQIKIKHFNIKTKISSLQTEFVTLASAKQRRGRAGRVKPGVCYHLYMKEREKTFKHLPVPEIRRSRLEDAILQIKYLQSGKVSRFMSKVMDPPEPGAIKVSVELLQTLNALDEDENLTPLGQYLAQMPLDPQTGKMVLLGAIFSCVDPVFSVAASLNHKEPFVLPTNKDLKKKAEDIRRKMMPGANSDHLVMAKAVMGWERASENGKRTSRKYCKQYFVSFVTLKMLRSMKWEFCEHLYKMNLLRSKNPKDWYNNINSNNVALVRAIICAGLYPNVAVVRYKNPELLHMRNDPNLGMMAAKLLESDITTEDGTVVIHPKSVNHEENFIHQFLVYYTKMKTSKVFLYDTTEVSAIPLLFFGKSFKVVKRPSEVIIQMDKNISFRCWETTADLIKELRVRLDKVLAHKIAYPDVTDWGQTSEEGNVLRDIIELLSCDGGKLKFSFEFQEIDHDDSVPEQEKRK